MNKKSLFVILIFLIGFLQIVSADELSERIVMEDIVEGRSGWKLVDSSISLNKIFQNVLQDKYYGNYEAEYEISETRKGHIRFGVTVSKPLSTTSEQLFEDRQGVYASFAGVNYKIVESGYGLAILWFSGNFLVEIAEGNIIENHKQHINSMDLLIKRYDEKYPSDVEKIEDCRQFSIGQRRENTYCSDDLGGILAPRDYKSIGMSCLNNYECKSNNCNSSGCVGNNFWNRFISWLGSFFD